MADESQSSNCSLVKSRKVIKVNRSTDLTKLIVIALRQLAKDACGTSTSLSAVETFIRGHFAIECTNVVISKQLKLSAKHAVRRGVLRTNDRHEYSLAPCRHFTKRLPACIASRQRAAVSTEVSSNDTTPLTMQLQSNATETPETEEAATRLFACDDRKQLAVGKSGNQTALNVISPRSSTSESHCAKAVQLSFSPSTSQRQDESVADSSRGNLRKQRKSRRIARPIPLCSFCRGSVEENRDGVPEILLCCVDCGYSGHPTCMKFSDRLVQRIKTLRWQCIECKRCYECNKKGACADSLLFCDGCDRGFHLDCLRPPLSCTPRDEWHCVFCTGVRTDEPKDLLDAAAGELCHIPLDVIAKCKRTCTVDPADKKHKLPKQTKSEEARTPRPRGRPPKSRPLVTEAPRAAKSVKRSRLDPNEPRKQQRKQRNGLSENVAQVAEIDLQMFRRAETTALKSIQLQSCDSSRLDSKSKQKRRSAATCCYPPTITIGKYQISTWYSAPYPQEYASLQQLFICEFCLSYFKSASNLDRHTEKCSPCHPPGNEIYRANCPSSCVQGAQAQLSVWEVDGQLQKLYCQNLCLLAKAFIDHKTLYYDVEPFLFYVLTVRDSPGEPHQLVGYFSKEKYCSSKYNVSCITVLPPYQRLGFGRFLIDFSYLLSRCERRPGTPERPLSELGRISYHAYWKSVLIEYLHSRLCKARATDSECNSNDLVTAFSVGDLVAQTGIQSRDLVETMFVLGFLVPAQRDGRLTVQLNASELEMYMQATAKKRAARIQIDPAALRWTPFVGPEDGACDEVEQDVEGSSSGVKVAEEADATSQMKAKETLQSDNDEPTPANLPNQQPVNEPVHNFSASLFPTSVSSDSPAENDEPSAVSFAEQDVQVRPSHSSAAHASFKPSPTSTGESVANVPQRDDQANKAASRSLQCVTSLEQPLAAQASGELMERDDLLPQAIPTDLYDAHLAHDPSVPPFPPIADLLAAPADVAHPLTVDVDSLRASVQTALPHSRLASMLANSPQNVGFATSPHSVPSSTVHSPLALGVQQSSLSPHTHAVPYLNASPVSHPVTSQATAQYAAPWLQQSASMQLRHVSLSQTPSVSFQNNCYMSEQLNSRNATMQFVEPTTISHYTYQQAAPNYYNCMPQMQSVGMTQQPTTYYPNVSHSVSCFATGQQSGNPLDANSTFYRSSQPYATVGCAVQRNHLSPDRNYVVNVPTEQHYLASCESETAYTYGMNAPRSQKAMYPTHVAPSATMYNNNVNRQWNAADNSFSFTALLMDNGRVANNLDSQTNLALGNSHPSNVSMPASVTNNNALRNEPNGYGYSQWPPVAPSVASYSANTSWSPATDWPGSFLP